jgi:hypothetical protein
MTRPGVGRWTLDARLETWKVILEFHGAGPSSFSTRVAAPLGVAPYVAAQGLELSEHRLGDWIVRVRIGRGRSDLGLCGGVRELGRGSSLRALTVGMRMGMSLGRAEAFDPLPLDALPGLGEQAAIRLELGQ